MEEASQKRARKADLKRTILDVVNAAGVVSIALLAPKTLSAFEKLGIVNPKRREESIRVARGRMIRQGFLEAERGGLRLTTKGKKELERAALKQGRLIQLRRWDGKWRVLIFDIPNRRKGLRDSLRKILRNKGFCRLQGSVWVYPHNCEDFVTLLKAELRIGKDMQYMIVDSIENDSALIDFFGLKRRG